MSTCGEEYICEIYGLPFSCPDTLKLHQNTGPCGEQAKRKKRKLPAKREGPRPALREKGVNSSIGMSDDGSFLTTHLKAEQKDCQLLMTDACRRGREVLPLGWL